MNCYRPVWMPHRVVLLLLLLLLSVALLAGCGSNAPSGDGSSDALQQNVINVIQQVQPSVVEIESRGTQGASIGSGEIWDTNGYIVTNDHVVSGFTTFLVRLGKNQTVSARLTGEAPQDDLAVLKITAPGLHPISLGDSSTLQAGQFVVAVGNPLGLAETATFGIVSALNRTASEGPNGPATTLTGMVQTSAPINPGNSGGALVDLDGRLVGVPTLAAVDPQVNAPANGIGFAIPVNRVKFVVPQLIQHGKLVNTGQGFLGIQGETVTPQLAAANHLSAQSGVLVVGYAKDTSGQSPAQQAGVRLGDVIVVVGEQPVTSSADIATVTLSQQPGTRVKVTVARGANQTALPVKLGQRPVGT